jgi:heat-inducible transcriptional repressor
MTQGLLTMRQHALLWRVIEQYIETGEPVSSKALETSGAFEVRSATIRNEMSELEEMGFVEQLHTSGGRVPTARAYRLYVNDLLAHEGVNIGIAARRRVDEALSETNLRDAEAVNKTLARLTGQLSQNLVMTNMSERPQPYTVGISSLMAFPEFREMGRMTGLVQFIDEFEGMFASMHRQMWGRDDGEVKVFIGTENPARQIRDETMIVARYRLPGGLRGSMTLVGPMRMDYRKNLGLITYAVQTANRIADHYER